MQIGNRPTLKVESRHVLRHKERPGGISDNQWLIGCWAQFPLHMAGSIPGLSKSASQIQAVVRQLPGIALHRIEASEFDDRRSITENSKRQHASTLWSHDIAQMLCHASRNCASRTFAHASVGKCLSTLCVFSFASFGFATGHIVATSAARIASSCSRH